jgi:hypothetical protein
MAVTLGFVVIFFAGVAIAYFAGLHASRPSIPVVPARSATTPTSPITTKSEIEAASTASITEKQELEDPPECKLPSDQSSDRGTQSGDDESFETR